MQSIQSHKEKIYDPKKKPHSSHKVEAVRNSAAATQLYNVPDDQREHVVDEVQKLISITRYPPCRTCLRSGDDEGATIKGSRHKSMKNPILIPRILTVICSWKKLKLIGLRYVIWQGIPSSCLWIMTRDEKKYFLVSFVLGCDLVYDQTSRLRRCDH